MNEQQFNQLFSNALKSFKAQIQKNFESPNAGPQTLSQAAQYDLRGFLHCLAQEAWKNSAQETQRLSALWVSRRMRERTGLDRFDDEGALLRADLGRLKSPPSLTGD